VEAPARRPQPDSSQLDVPGGGEASPAPLPLGGDSGGDSDAQDLLESFGDGSGSGLVPPGSGGEIPSTPSVPPAAGTPGGDSIPAPAPPAGEGPEGDTSEPPPAAPPFEANENPGPEPLAPIGVGIGTGGLALGGVLFLGRRFGW
jgi:hypothetical protein